MFHQTRCNMGVMMLYLHQWYSFSLSPFLSQTGGEVLRMFIDRDTLGLVIEQLPVQFEVVMVVPKGYRIFKIADVLGKNRPPFLQQTECVLQLTAHGQNVTGIRKAIR